MRIYAVKATLGRSLKSNNCLIITRKDLAVKFSVFLPALLTLNEVQISCHISVLSDWTEYTNFCPVSSRCWSKRNYLPRAICYLRR